MNKDLQRCEREIAKAEAELRAGNPEIAGLLLAILDWEAEAEAIRREIRREKRT